MKKTYTRKQIQEAVSYWKDRLNEETYRKATMMSTIAGKGPAYMAFCDFTPGDSEYDAEWKFKKVYQVLVYSLDNNKEYILFGDKYYKGQECSQFELTDIPLNADEMVDFSEVEIHSSVYTSYLLRDTAGGVVGETLIHIHDGDEFGLVDGKRPYEFTDEHQFDMMFKDMCETLHIDVDTEAATMEFKLNDHIGVKVCFVK